MKVYWKPFPSHSIHGNAIIMPGILDEDITLLTRMLNMPEGKHVSYHEAQQLYWDEFSDYVSGFTDPKKVFILENIVDWGLKKGYKIIPSENDYEILPSTESA